MLEKSMFVISATSDDEQLQPIAIIEKNTIGAVSTIVNAYLNSFGYDDEDWMNEVVADLFYDGYYDDSLNSGIVMMLSFVPLYKF